MSVYANGRAIAGRAKQGKSTACFPDPCFAPPALPAPPGWTVVPFANTAYARHTSKASKTVFIEGKPVMLKDKSYFSTSTGNEPATGPKSLMTKTKKGKAYFTSWSMDVKIEGYNVCRHMDGMDHNHGSSRANTPPWVYIEDAIDKDHPCHGSNQKIKEECGDEENWRDKHCQGLTQKPYSVKKETCKAIVEDLDKLIPAGDNNSPLKQFRDKVSDLKGSGLSGRLADMQMELAKENPCLQARRCMLVPYKDTANQCCPGQTGHHIIPNSYMYKGAVKNKKKKCKAYNKEDAPTICVEGARARGRKTKDKKGWIHTSGSHGEIHRQMDALFEGYKKKYN